VREADITATFGPAPGDRTTLSKASSRTIDAIYQHPLSHNLEWSDVVALFEKLGTVDQKHHNDITFGIAGEHHRVRKPHGKDLTADDVMAFRHMLTRAGWALPEKSELKHEALGAPGATSRPATPVAADAARPALLAVVEHHETRIYHLNIDAADVADHVILPYDPHHFLHHLTHKDESAERGQRAPESHVFYEEIAQALLPAGRIVLVGHGKGHSNAAHHLAEYLREHHHETFLKIVSETIADSSSLTVPQLLVLGRRTLTA
jgi:hypothetical protein